MSEINEDLKCVICAKYLTVAPVFHIPEKGYVCGRSGTCASKSNGGEHQILYEILTQNAILPCCYKSSGCKVQLKWGKVSKHENSCNFRNTLCPLSDGNKEFLSLDKVCSWSGIIRFLKSHLLSQHTDYFCHPVKEFLGPMYTTTFKFDILLEDCVTMVIFKYDEINSKYIINVLADLSDIECSFFQYQAEVKHTSSTQSMIFRDNNQVKPLMCDTIFENELTEGLYVPLKSVFENIGSVDSYNVTVSICKKNKKYIKHLLCNLPQESILKRTSIKSSPLNELGLKDLECPICQDYMMEPIFLCVAGHSVCKDCKPRVNSCPTCRAQMTDTRNYCLESLGRTINYPCRNRSSGCFFVALGEKIRNHERNCSFKVKTCPFNCEWSGNTLDMVVHLNEYHVLLPVNQIKTIIFTEQEQVIKEAISFDNQVFIFTCFYSYLMGFVYSLQHLRTGNVNYKYELMIIDSSENDLYILMNHLCSLFVNGDTFILPCEMILPFQRFHELQYKIKILRIEPNS